MRQAWAKAPDAEEAAARADYGVATLLPAMAALRSLFQGVLVHHHETRGIPESVALFLGVAVGLSLIGVVAGDIAGLFVVVPAMSTGMAAQAAWLAVRSRHLRARMR